MNYDNHNKMSSMILNLSVNDTFVSTFTKRSAVSLKRLLN